MTVIPKNAEFTGTLKSSSKRTARVNPVSPVANDRSKKDLAEKFSGKDSANKPKHKIALFVGSDVTTHLILNQVLPNLIEKGIEPFIFLVKETISEKQRQEGAYGFTANNYRFFERRLTREVLYPYLESNAPRLDKNGNPIKGLKYTPKHLGQIYNVKVQTVRDINDPAFVRSLGNDQTMIGGLSIRCYQIFKKDVINAFKNKAFNKQGGFLWNIHPGPLPSFRGFLGPVHAVANGDKKYSWTLHEIGKGIDTGAIIDTRSHSIKSKDSPIHLYTNFTESVSEMISNRINQVMDGRLVRSRPQKERKTHYYNYADMSKLERKLDATQLQGIQPNAQHMQKLLTESFTMANSLDRRKVSTALGNKINSWARTSQQTRHSCEKAPAL